MKRIDPCHRFSVGSYNTPDQAGVAIIDVDDTGTYNVVSQLTGIDNPSFMTQHGTHIYAVSETATNGGVVAITRNGTTLSHGIRRPSGGAGVAMCA
jgi:6-phosphogluconolactonase (cycloisomerase 2 family)